MFAQVLNGDGRRLPLADEIVQCVITSPPYWGLRDYGVDGQLGSEATPAEFVENLVAVFREVGRVLRDDGTVWLNLGDSYAGGGRGGNSEVITGKGKDASIIVRSKRVERGNGSGRWGGGDVAVPDLPAKNLVGIPWRVALALQADGWYLRQDIIWHKPNPMPESVKDRCTKAHEYVFLLSKSERYYFDGEAIAEDGVSKVKDKNKVPSGWDTNKRAHGTVHQEGRSAPEYSFKRRVNEEPPPGQPAQHREDREDVEYSDKRNKRSVWTVSTRGYKGAHFATFPPKLVEPMVLAGSAPGDVVLDPFAGTATVGQVCIQHGRSFVGVELKREYIGLARRRLAQVQMVLI